MSKIETLKVGRRFGKWTVLSTEHRLDASGHACFRVMCECGQISHIRGNKLRNGESARCAACRYQRIDDGLTGSQRWRKRNKDEALARNRIYCARWYWKDPQARRRLYAGYRSSNLELYRDRDRNWHRANNLKKALSR